MPSPLSSINRSWRNSCRAGLNENVTLDGAEKKMLCQRNTKEGGLKDTCAYHHTSAGARRVDRTGDALKNSKNPRLASGEEVFVVNLVLIFIRQLTRIL